ncbi:Mss4-like protein [Tuber borchii]|uniref:Mss4-like protein n=1 Tax=Tuber borchii TaxID=42251 RepID=A0A2T6ZL41_TUBBO|nr:Mss4-like protein [Tuber borchii]
MTSTEKTYEGSCHCKSVKLSVTLPAPIEEQKVINCNCSLCVDRALLIFFAAGDKVTIEGEEHLNPYSFNKKVIHYHFCKNCGSILFGHDKDKTQYGINARCISGVDLDKLQLVKHDGASS